MEPNDTFLRAFLHACLAGDLSKTQEAIATGRLTAENLNEGLKLATHIAYSEIMAALFNTGASVLALTVLAKDSDLQANWLTDSVINSMLINPVSACELLLRKIPSLDRALVTIKKKDLSLLNLYIKYRAILSVDLLIFAIASCNMPLHCAIYYTRSNIVKLLLDTDTDPTIVSGGRKTYGKSPMQVAESVPDPGTRRAILSLLDSQARQDFA
ncbi:uncharacterized protein BDW43DRAFT_322215 [Aspergillus alliaceus]|uniref:uncharacterized protein n=1 Tax=Petromyces alliaceus TaxID=209559 RepID=UPI0012A65F75|nr:uncharacterized protein BDW43DRAFT_322215 [Aspergillus alliaceus]KAB8229430.1 hypothetical protein BDW43DRAFT_322215 [Aspergillus alliaceus]